MARKRANGEGSIYRTETGWRGYILAPDGKRVTRKARTRAEVLDKLEEAKRSLAVAGVVGSATVTVEAYLARWLAEASPGLKPETARKYSVHVRLHLVPHLGRVKLAELQPSHIRTLHSTLAANGLSRTSVAHVHATLRRALNSALADGVVARNAAALVPLPKRDTVEQEWLSPEEVRKLVVGVAGSEHEARVLVALLGIRQGEALALRWEDLDTSGRTLLVRGALSRSPSGLQLLEPKTPKSRRLLSLPPEVVEAFERHRERQAAHYRAHGLRPALGLMFPDPFGELQHPARDWRLWKQALSSAGVRHVGLHAGRHSYATSMLVAGADLKAVADSLGHSSLSMLHARYAHVADEMRTRTGELAGRALFG